MRALLALTALAATLAAAGSTTAAAQDLSFREMRWRDIGPTRAGRARALAGVASQPNTFSLQAAGMTIQAAEVAPTATQAAAAAAARAQARPVMARWAAVKAKAASLRP